MMNKRVARAKPDQLSLSTPSRNVNGVLISNWIYHTHTHTQILDMLEILPNKVKLADFLVASQASALD